MCGILTEWGFDVHEIESPGRQSQLLGLYFDGEEGRISLAPSRVWKLRLAIVEYVRQNRFTPRGVEILVGHLTFSMLLRREALSVFSAVYRYIQRHRRPPLTNAQNAFLQQQVRFELLQASALLPLLHINLRAPWDSTVFASDSSTSGYGICQARFPLSSVASFGRNIEKLRFHCEEAVQARAHALDPNRVELDPLDPGRFLQEAED
jgi:hypothetical protein